MLGGFLEQFPLPEVAMEGIRRSNLQTNNLGEGVDIFLAHDKGVSYRFFNHADYDKEASKKLRYEKFNNIAMIEWYVDKKTKPTERVTQLPRELLSFDDEGNCIGGKYKDAYEAFLRGLNAPGLPLSKWGILDDAECATLAASGVFSVEQLAALPRSKVEGKYPSEIVEAFERAIQYVNGKTIRAENEKRDEEILKLKAESEAKDAAIKELQAQMAALMTGEDVSKKTKKKVTTEEE